MCTSFGGDSSGRRSPSSTSSNSSSSSTLSSISTLSSSSRRGYNSRTRHAVVPSTNSCQNTSSQQQSQHHACSTTVGVVTDDAGAATTRTRIRRPTTTGARTSHNNHNSGTQAASSLPVIRLTRFSVLLCMLLWSMTATTSTAMIASVSAFSTSIRSTRSRSSSSSSSSSIITPTRIPFQPVRRPQRIVVSAADGPSSDGIEGNGDGAPAAVVPAPPKKMRSVEPRVYPQRWVQLGYLSALALLSDWICFSVAATPDTYEAAFGHSAAQLIDMFLFTNVASCFLVTDVVKKIGLQRAVQGAAALMAVGCWFRSGISFLPVAATGPEHLVSYPLVVIGTILVGAAQPFFQCTPPLLSAQWFAASERATSTAIALNFNQIGIATAFLVGGSMATTVNGLETYFGLIAVLCTLTALGSFVQFQNLPPIPPSTSEMEKRFDGHVEPPFLTSVQTFFKTPGFTHALAAFVCSISITNIVGAFIDEVLERGGITEQLSIDLAGAGFELAILVGGIVIGGFVDKSKQYKRMTQICLGVTALLVVPLGLTEHAIGKEPVLLLFALVGLGFFSGPVQPINAELAVDVTYPGDETAVESVQQIGGNLISALLVPIAELASKRDYQLLPNVQWAASDIRGDAVLLVVLAMLTICYFVSFDAPLLRTMADDDGGESFGTSEDSKRQGTPLNTSNASNTAAAVFDATILSSEAEEAVVVEDGDISDEKSGNLDTDSVTSSRERTR